MLDNISTEKKSRTIIGNFFLSVVSEPHSIAAYRAGREEKSTIPSHPYNIPTTEPLVRAGLSIGIVCYRVSTGIFRVKKAKGKRLDTKVQVSGVAA